MQSLPSPPPGIRGQSGPDTYTVTAPDGTTYEVEAPAGATQAEILSQARKYHEASSPDRANKMSPEDEQAYQELAANPKSSTDDLVNFLGERGFGVDRPTVDAFVKARNKPGAKVWSRMSYQLPKAPPRAAKPQGVGSTVAGAIGQFVSGAAPGVSELARGVANVGKDLVDGGDINPANAFKQGGFDQLDAEDQFAADNPNISTGLNVGGFGASVFLPEARLARGSGLLAQSVNSGVTSGTYGLAEGALNDTGDGRVVNALTSGAVGTLMGAAAPGVMRGATALGRAGMRNIPGASTGLRLMANPVRALRGQEQLPAGYAGHAQGERMLGDMLPSDNIATGMGRGNTPATPQAVADEIARRNAMGVPAMPADLNDQNRRITAWALQGRGQMASSARARLFRRQAEAGGRVQQQLHDTMGDPVAPEAHMRGIIDDARETVRPLYQQAYAQPLQITPEMVQMLRTPAGRQALPRAIENIENDLGDPRAMGLILDDEGNIVRQARDLSVEGLDQTIRAMRQTGRDLADKNALTGAVQHNTWSSPINARAGNLSDMLAEQNPHYGRAVSDYADANRIRDAFDQGRDVSRLTGPQIAEQLHAFPANNGPTRDAWTLGATSELSGDVAKFGNDKPTGNVADALRRRLGLPVAGLEAAAGDTAKQRAIEDMMGRPGALRDLDQRLEAESQAGHAFSEAFGNSKTATREELNGHLSGDALKNAASLLTGSPTQLAASVLLKTNPAGTLNFKGDVQNRIADLMTAQTPEEVNGMVQAIMGRMASDARFRAQMDQAGITMAKLATIHGAAMDTAGNPEEIPLPTDYDLYGTDY